jgi:hypothetical protein
VSEAYQHVEECNPDKTDFEWQHRGKHTPANSPLEFPPEEQEEDTDDGIPVKQQFDAFD